MKDILLAFLFLSFGIVSSQSKSTFTYAVKGIDSLQLDVYTPENLISTGRLPVILWVHGGGFSQGSREGSEELAMMNFANSKGFIGVSISYRLLRKGRSSGFGCNCSSQDKLYTFASATEDLLDAIKYITEHHIELKIDLEKIIIAGVSAGAETVLNAAYLRSYFLTNTSEYDELKIAGVIAISGAVVNIDTISEMTALPTLLIHGNQDNTVPFGYGSHHNCEKNKKGFLNLYGSETMYQKLTDLKRSVYFHEINGGTHAVAKLPENELPYWFTFIEQTIFKNQSVQTKKVTNDN
ncbi:MAG: alpha/beta hydrolase [Psychroserpens sp.]|nr:alpha/beta hydrolase [Psychroserpens sp.]